MQTDWKIPPLIFKTKLLSNTAAVAQSRQKIITIGSATEPSLHIFLIDDTYDEPAIMDINHKFTLNKE